MNKSWQISKRSRRSFICGIFLILFLTTATGVGLSFDIAESGRIEFIDGERHMLEHFAGIVGGGRNTFLFGDGIFRSVNEILRGTLDTYDGKEAERDGKHLAVVLVRDPSVQTVADDLGEVLCVEMAVMVELAHVENTGVEDERVNDLKNGGWKIVSGTFRMAAATEIRMGGVALKDVDVAFATVENDLFLHYGNAVGLLCSAQTSADLHGDLDIHGNADLIKASVERHVVDVDVCAEDLCAFGADRGSAFQ